ncbi:hypothetical protein LEN26_003115 [Aphanomyces euteiches]|nr:hypothetical protein LEN26_003115 [Aphanomyces euteiches]
MHVTRVCLERSLILLVFGSIASVCYLATTFWTPRDVVIPHDLVAQLGYRTKFANATRGIVMTMSTAMVPMGTSLIQELRQLGNTDPIQIMYCLDSDLSQDAQTLLNATDPNVELIDLCELLVHAKLFGRSWPRAYQSYWLKPLALLGSSFDQVLLMDVDNIFVEDPAVLWTSKSFLDKGMVFFYDRVVDLKWAFNLPWSKGRTYLSHFLDHFPYEMFNLSYAPPSPHLRDSRIFAMQTAHEQDSSVVLIDKTRAGKTVLNVLWYLATYERIHGRQFSHGDKETFWLAFELAHVPSSFSPWGAAVVSQAQDMALHPDTLCGSLAQYLPQDDATPRLFYVNGRDVIDLVDVNARNATNWTARSLAMTNSIPDHVSPRQTRHVARDNFVSGEFQQTCMVGDGATPLPPSFKAQATRRIQAALDVALQMNWSQAFVPEED